MKTFYVTIRKRISFWTQRVRNVMYAPFVPITGDDGSRFAEVLRQDNQTLGEFLNLAFRLAMGIAAMLAVSVVLYAGFRYMTSTTPHTKEYAKKRLREAITGILILISIVLILQYINPDILCLDFELPNPESGATTETSRCR